MMKTISVVLPLALLVSACGEKIDKTVDRGIDANTTLATMRAGIWVDPNGCQHWIIDDGVEGYLSPRLAPDGGPVCNTALPRNTALGDFKGGGTSVIGDPI